jgi:hypothetical protein
MNIFSRGNGLNPVPGNGESARNGDAVNSTRQMNVNILFLPLFKSIDQRSDFLLCTIKGCKGVLRATAVFVIALGGDTDRNSHEIVPIKMSVPIAEPELFEQMGYQLRPQL